MSFLLDFKLWIAGLFLIGIFACLAVTTQAKKEHDLCETKLGIYPNYTAEDFRQIMTGNSETATDPRAAHYVRPISFPYDLLLLICIGGCAAFASLALAGFARVPNGIVPWLVLVPALYMVSDLAENSLISWLLMRPSPALVTDGIVNVTRVATGAKLFLLGLSACQFLALLAAAAYFCIRGRTGI